MPWVPTEKEANRHVNSTGTVTMGVTVRAALLQNGFKNIQP